LFIDILGLNFYSRSYLQLPWRYFSALIISAFRFNLSSPIHFQYDRGQLDLIHSIEQTKHALES